MADSKEPNAKAFLMNLAAEFSLIYTTCPDLATAEKISLTLLEEKFVACTNILPVMHSQYWWEGKIESSKETVLILKTSKALKDRTQARFTELHPYEVPCFLEISIDSGNAPYLEWLAASLR